MSLAEQAALLSHEELVEAYLVLHQDTSGQIVSLTDSNSTLTEQNEELQQQVDWLKRQLFGKKSERILPADDSSSRQLTLGEGYEPEDKPPPKKTTVKSYERSQRKDEVEFAEDESRLKFDESVPVEEVRVPNPATDGLSEDEYEVIGEEVVHKLAQRPGAYVVLKYVRSKVKIKGSGEVTTALVTPAASVIERSIAEVSFLVGLILDKFLYHLPLYRQHQRLIASGVYLNRMTLTNLVHRSAQLLEPVYVALQSSILLSSVIAMDETPVKAGRDKAKRQMKKGYFWSIYGEKGELAFLFSPSRSGKVVRDVLGQFEGTLLTDAYKVYEVFAELNDEVIRAQCWAHARRKFFEAKDYEPELSEKALDTIRLLYKVEQEHGPKGRNEHARPIVNDFFDWLEKTALEHALLPSSPFLKAVSYALKNERALRVFLDNPKVALDTNHVERDNRLNAVGRKNYMFHWTEVGAKYAAILYSLIATCRHQNVNPYTYLVDVLQRIQTHPMRDIHLLTPTNWKQSFQDNPLTSDLKNVAG